MFNQMTFEASIPFILFGAGLAKVGGSYLNNLTRTYILQTIVRCTYYKRFSDADYMVTRLWLHQMQLDWPHPPPYYIFMMYVWTYTFCVCVIHITYKWKYNSFRDTFLVIWNAGRRSASTSPCAQGATGSWRNVLDTTTDPRSNINNVNNSHQNINNSHLNINNIMNNININRMNNLQSHHTGKTL